MIDIERKNLVNIRKSNSVVGFLLGFFGYLALIFIAINTTGFFISKNKNKKEIFEVGTKGCLLGILISFLLSFIFLLIIALILYMSYIYYKTMNR